MKHRLPLHVFVLLVGSIQNVSALNTNRPHVIRSGTSALPSKLGSHPQSKIGFSKSVTLSSPPSLSTSLYMSVQDKKKEEGVIISSSSSTLKINGDHNKEPMTTTLVGDSSPSTIKIQSESKSSASSSSPAKSTPNANSDLVTGAANATITSAQEAVDDIAQELARLINESFDDLWVKNQNITEAIEKQVEYLTKESTLSPNVIVDSFAEAIAQLQDDQRKQLLTLQNQAERKIVELVEEIAFADTPISKQAENGDIEDAEILDPKQLPHQSDLPFEVSKRMKTREIMRYWKVAPLYYTLALVLRMINKAPGPRSIWLTTTRSVSSLFGGRKSRGSAGDDAYQAFIKNADSMQSGWKRTGEIASKGPFRRQMEIFRRSLEIWSYFTSFYLKEKRMLKKYKSGKWTEEQFSKGRSQLGAEVTQNLLKLGPTFIKVGWEFSLTMNFISFFFI